MTLIASKCKIMRNTVKIEGTDSVRFSLSFAFPSMFALQQQLVLICKEQDGLQNIFFPVLARPLVVGTNIPLTVYYF